MVDISKMSLQICYGHYMFFVIYLCLIEYIDLMNRVFRQYLDMFVIVFFDDIMIHSRSENEHMDYKDCLGSYQGQTTLCKSLSNIHFGEGMYLSWFILCQNRGLR